MDIDTYIKQNYRPVDDKPGYFWINARGCRMAHIDVLRKAYNDISKNAEYILETTSKED